MSRIIPKRIPPVGDSDVWFLPGWTGHFSGRLQRLEGVVVASAENALPFAVEVVAVLV